MVLRARDVMTRRVVTAFPETTIERAAEVLTENRFSALPVVDDRHRLVGIVTTSDLLRAAVVHDRVGEPVGEVMTTSPMFMTSDADVRIIAHRLRRYGERRAMPIVDKGVVVGIVTRGDILRRPPRGGPVGRWFDRLTPGRPHHRGWRSGGRGGRCAADVMTPLEDVICVDEDALVDTAAALLAQNRWRALPVLSGDDLVGVVSEADLLPDRLTGRRTPLPRTVGGAMSRDLVTVRASTSTDDLARAMVSRGLRMVPVVDDDDRMVGVVSRGDLLREEYRRRRSTSAASSPSSSSPGSVDERHTSDVAP